MKGTSKYQLAFLLVLPILAWTGAYLFNHSPELQPTGFIQYDNVSYIAYAHQYLDADTIHFTYSNPFEPSGSQVYFQPQTVFFTLLLKLGIPPAYILIPFTLICSYICFVLLISIYDLLFPGRKFRELNIWLFAWGGGLIALCSMAAHFFMGHGNNFSQDFFLLDPEGGWWGLNLGRSLLFTCEAYYHLLFLGTIYFILKRKMGIALLLIVLLSMSHPFTGIELIAIVFTWSVIEYIRNRDIPLWFVACIALTGILHVYYYLFFLNGFPDHQSVSSQYTLNWRLGWYRMIPAYCITGALAIASVRLNSFKHFFQSRSNRLFACWFAVAFLLANHEVIMTARQPVHFTRGYIWTSLFLLGIPALLAFQDYLQKRWLRTGLILLSVILLFDNALWIALHAAARPEKPYANYITEEQKKVLVYLDEESSNKTVIVSSDETIGYLSSVFTKGIPWYSHPYTTPFAQQKKTAQQNLLVKGIIDSSWMHQPVNFVLYKSDSLAFKNLLALPLNKIIRTNQYSIVIFKP
jgi:hypothetical protein